MIRRSPTRIELKLDDIQEFEYVQKKNEYDKKKPAADNGATLSGANASKLQRHERIGLHRPGPGAGRGLCMSSTCTSSSGNDTTTSTQVQQPSSSSTGSTATMTGVTSTAVPAANNNVEEEGGRRRSHEEGRSATTTTTIAEGAVGASANNDEGAGGNVNMNNTSTEGTTPESTLDTLPSEIGAHETNDMDLIDFNSTYASANMSMDET